MNLGMKVKYLSRLNRAEEMRSWLTDDRLDRWNHIRDRAGLAPVSHEQAVVILVNADEETLKSIKERI